jgi:hypothetical protein
MMVQGAKRQVSRPSQIRMLAALTAAAVVLAASPRALAQGEGADEPSAETPAGEEPGAAEAPDGGEQGDQAEAATASASDPDAAESTNSDEGAEIDPGGDAEAEASDGAEAAGVETEGDDGESAEADAESDEVGPPPPLPPNAMPGSPRPPGLGLSPEAPPGPPAPGGRAPSFGSPMPDDDWTFGISGRISGYQMVGFGRPSSTAPSESEGVILHAPPVTYATPYWAGAALTLNFIYGNPRVSANVSFNGNITDQTRRGYHMSNTGPDIVTAYLAYTPEPLGRMQLRFKVGAFRENYGGPGEWGWGVNGPLLGVKGYGESMSGEMPLTANTQLLIGQGVMVTPSVPEDFVRGDALGWVETGRSTWVHHWHAGLSFRNQYVVKVHAASALGTDKRDILTTPLDANGVPSVDSETLEPLPNQARDGHMNAYVLELRGVFDPFGQLGISTGYWDFKNAETVHDGIFWGIGWTAGGREMVNNFVGPDSGGNGKLGAISAEYSFSIARMLWHPRAFDGRAPDIRVKLGAILYRTLQSDDTAFDQTSGYQLNPQAEYQMLKWFALNLRYQDSNRQYYNGRFRYAHLTTALVFKRDWQSLDRIELAYSRMFYSDLVDNNPAAPMDRDIVTLGAVMSF